MKLKLIFTFLAVGLLFSLSSQAKPNNEHEWLYAWVDHLSIREQPNLEAKVKGRLSDGQEVLWEMEKSQHSTEVTLRGKKYNLPWYKVSAEGIEGWVNAAGLSEEAPRYYLKTIEHKPAEWFNTPARRFKWWNGQSDAWKEAFDGGIWAGFDDPEVRQPSDEKLLDLFHRTDLNLEAEPPCENAYFTKDLIDLSGVRNLSNLQYLGITGTKIISLRGIEELTQLKILNLTECQISEDWDRLERLKNLEELDLSYNDLENIQKLPALSGLKVLNVSSCGLADLKGISRFAQVSTLHIAYNEITDLQGIESLSNLSQLGAPGNQISHLNPLKDLRELAILDASINEIKDISGLADLENLEHLELGGNQIDNLRPLAKLTEVSWLDLGDNPLGSLRVFMDNLPFPKLTQLDLSACEIQDLSALKSLPKLEVLLLFEAEFNSLNPLKSFPSLKEIGWYGGDSYEVPVEMEQEFQEAGISFRPEYEGCGC